MVKRHLSLLVVAVACIALLGGCASKYGAQTTQVNYYPQCYSPVAQLRADEDRVNNSTAGGAAGGALLGALIGGLATGKVEGALAGAVAGGAAGAVGGNIYGKSQQRENDRRLLASYAAQLGEDSAGMDRATAAARPAAMTSSSRRPRPSTRPEPSPSRISRTVTWRSAAASKKRPAS